MKTQFTTKKSLLLYFLYGCKKFFFISIIAALGVTAVDMLLPQVIRFTVDSVIDDKAPEIPEFLATWVEGLGGRAFLREHLYYIAAVIVIMALAAAFFKYLTTKFNVKGAESLMQRMRNRLYGHIQHLPFSWHMKNQTGDIIQRCTSDVDMIKNFVSEQLSSVVRIVILMALSLTFMFSMNYKLSLVAVVTIPIIVTYSTFFHKRIGHLFTECDENEGILSTITQENLTGVRIVRAFGRENYERDRFEKQNNIYTNMWIKLCKMLAAFWGLGDLVSGLQVMLIVIIGAVFCVNGDMTAGEFIAFISYNSMLIWPVRQLGRMISEMSKAGVSIERIRYIMASETEQDAADAICPDMTGDIEFSHVSFSYGESEDVLKDLNFTIEGGKTFGILGGTGSGKSTLMHLLNRLYDLPPENGKITIGGVDIADMKSQWVRSNIGMVLQEPFLFSRTIAENIGITKEHIDMSEIKRAASIACIDDAISEFAKGYDTIVGERGVTLSGGQKQRTAIARMLTQRAPIMVFDDSLSAVDAETDMSIRRELKKNLKDATVILISHRITTLMQADKIMVMDKGRIAEIGSHDELLAQNGIYKKIYDMQSSM